jgi:hypothetical protein
VWIEEEKCQRERERKRERERERERNLKKIFFQNASK